MGTLSVRENFAFSAALRLPSSIKASERKERINNVIKELGLERCADTKVSKGSNSFRSFTICMLFKQMFIFFIFFPQNCNDF